MRKLMFLLLLNCSQAFAIEQVFVASHAMKTERVPGSSYYRLEAYDRDGFKRITVEKQVHMTGGFEPVVYYSFGIKETMSEGWRFQQVSAADYKVLLNHLATTPESGFMRRFSKGCVATVDISTNQRLYGGSVNSCIAPNPEDAIVAEQKAPAPSRTKPSEATRRPRYKEANGLLESDSAQIEAVGIDGIVR